MNNQNHSPITAVLVGAGLRGREVYGRYAELHPDKLKIIAIAEPDDERRRLFQREHGIGDRLALASWDKLFELGLLADAAFICTQDSQHFWPAVHAMNLGYHLVLEKPVSPKLDECQHLAKMARERARIVQVCHVLRYTDFWRKIKELVSSGVIGQVVHYDHSENVSYWHFGHSYVRGHYKNAAASSPLILAKSCHDLDLMYWIIGEKPITVQSVGGLSHYRPENAPEGAPERCTEGCPEQDACPWYAPRLYLTAEPLLRIGMYAPARVTRSLAHLAVNHRWVLEFLSRFNKGLKSIVNWEQFPASVITTDLTYEGKMKALEEGPFGKCIYKCGNDVMDHQITTYTFPGGATGTLTLHGLSDLEGRELRIFGTRGAIRGYFRYNGEEITVTDFRYTKVKTVYKAGLTMEGHGGGDTGLMDSFVRVMRGLVSAEEGGADIDNALEAHYMAFAAEEARINGGTLNISDFR